MGIFIVIWCSFWIGRISVSARYRRVDWTDYAMIIFLGLCVGFGYFLIMRGK